MNEINKNNYIQHNNNKITKKLINILQDEKFLLFYKTMGYPIPKSYHYLKTNKKTNITNNDYHLNDFSREKENEYLKEYFEYINKYGLLFKSIPFIKRIYLCNSITFNGLKENSDIDLFIITKKGYLWLARLFSLIIFSLIGAKRSIKNKHKKFCLSFYITEDSQNLYNISIPYIDIYLIYRIAHLVIIYKENDKDDNNEIYESNKWIKNFLPNFPNKQIINLKYNKVFVGKSFFKKFIEFLIKNKIGKFIEFLIKNIRSPIVINKSKKHKDRGRGIIINQNMLKFHMDMRRKIHFKYNILTKKNGN